MNKNKLIVISMDALVREDLELLRHMPSFSWLLQQGARVERVRSIYPTLTYPCHVTMATGCYPDKHGVVTNWEFIPGVEQLPWKWYHRSVACEDILDACKKAGLTTAAVGWPVTGNHPSVDWLVDEIWPLDNYTMERFTQAYLESGTTQELFDAVVAPNLWLRVSRTQPESTYFTTRVSCDIIRKYQPDLLMIHTANMDNYRHETGVFSPKTAAGLIECEKVLTELILATKEAGVFEQTNFVVTADHGHLDTTRIVNPNVLFRRHGLVKTDDAGNITDWQVWAYSNGMSALICLKDPEDKKLYDQVYQLLKDCCDEGMWGFSSVFTREETAAMERLDGPFSFVLETDNYSQFGISWQEPYAKNLALGLSGIKKGYHGYHPDKGPWPTFLGCGPAFHSGAVLEQACIVDGAPTYARILNVEMPWADGRVLTELLAEER